MGAKLALAYWFGPGVVPVGSPDPIPEQRPPPASRQSDGVWPAFLGRPCHCHSEEQTGGRRSRGRKNRKEKKREKGWPRCLFRLLKKPRHVKEKRGADGGQDDEMATVVAVAVPKVQGAADHAEDRAAAMAGRGEDDGCGSSGGEVEGAEDGAELPETDSEEEPHPEGTGRPGGSYGVGGRVQEPLLTIHRDNTFHPWEISFAVFFHVSPDPSFYLLFGDEGREGGPEGRERERVANTWVKKSKYFF